MKSIRISEESKLATQAGIQWGFVCGVTNKRDAKKMLNHVARLILRDDQTASAGSEPQVHHR